MTKDPLLHRLRSRIGSEIDSVKPIAAPWKRASFLFPLWALMVVLVLSIFGLRADYPVFGPLVFWSVALLQLLLAYGLLFLGLKSVVPGMATSFATLSLATSGALMAHLYLSWWAFRISPVAVTPGSEWRTGLACFFAIVFLALLPIVLTASMASAGLPLSPLTTGLLLSLAGGLAGEAAWRMHCPFSSMDHIFSFHTGAVLVVALTGLLCGLLWRRFSEPREV